MTGPVTPQDLNQQLAGVLKISRRTMVMLLTVVPVLLVVSLALNGYLLYQAAGETARIRDAVAHQAASLTQLCRTGNDFRAQQVVLWDHLVAISKAPPHETVQARTDRLHTAKAFLAYVDRVFAPRDCAAPNRTETP